MPAILYGLLAWAMGSAVARILLGAGLGLGTYAVLSTILNDLLADLVAEISLLGAAAQILYLAGIGEALSIVGGAMVARVALGSAKVFVTRAS